MDFKAKVNKPARLARKNGGEELVFILSIDIGRTVYGNNYCKVVYSEIYGCFETSVSFDEIDYIIQEKMTKEIKSRLIQKWGYDICKMRGIRC